MLALFAVVLELVISGNTLTALGIGYDTPGGSPLVKFCPERILLRSARSPRCLQAPARAAV